METSEDLMRALVGTEPVTQDVETPPEVQELRRRNKTDRLRNAFQIDLNKFAAKKARPCYVCACEVIDSAHPKLAICADDAWWLTNEVKR